MKKLFFTFMLLCMSSALYAQNDVTKFLGIPVDGSKSEMIRQLKEKGFTTSPYESDVLEGEFNGADVNIYIATTRNKVSRIMVADKSRSDESQIKIRFNTLCKQFENNQKYIGLENQAIPEDDDISYEMTVHNKEYQAAFYQKGEGNLEKRLVWFTISKSYGMYCILMYYDNEYNRASGEDL